MSIHPRCARFANYCQKNNIDFIVVDAYSSELKRNTDVNWVNAEHNIDPQCVMNVTWNEFFDPETYQNLEYSHIVNFRDNIKWVELENVLYEKLHGRYLFDDTTFEFISKKSKQDEIYQLAGIPRIGNEGDEYVVKLDAGEGGGYGFRLCLAKDYVKGPNEFIQTRVDFRNIYGLSVYVDNDSYWHVLTYCRTEHEDNCPFVSLVGVDEIVCIKYIPLLKPYVKLKNRLIFWQFLEDMNGEKFALDFNSRPSGGFPSGSLDYDITDMDFCEIYHHGIVPTEILKHSMGYHYYDEKKMFGFSTWRTINMKHNMPIKYRVPRF